MMKVLEAYEKSLEIKISREAKEKAEIAFHKLILKAGKLIVRDKIKFDLDPDTNKLEAYYARLDVTDITRTDKTNQEYLKCGGNLWVRAPKELDMPTDYFFPLIYILWLEDILPKYKASTIRKYIIYSRVFLESLLDQPKRKYGGDLKELLDAIKKVNKMHYSDFVNSDTNSIKDRTFAIKAKHISQEEIETIEKGAEKLRGKSHAEAIVWIKANYHMGLRPCEWKNANIVELENELYLKVLNSKNTNGRSHGEFRHIIIKNPEIQRLVEKQLENASKYNKYDKDWTRFQKRARTSINILSRKFLSIRDNYPSIYSTRHQFIANLKKSKVRRAEIAALVGHATDRTISQCYPHQSSGSVGHFMTAVQEEVDRVRLIYTHAKPSRKSGLRL